VNGLLGNLVGGEAETPLLGGGTFSLVVSRR